MDYRDSHNRHWWKSIDWNDKLAIVCTGEEDVEVNWHYEVCPKCQGEGRYVNPNIDRNGISPEQFAEDPDFADQYFCGIFDVKCNLCEGKRVYPVCSDEEVLLKIHEIEQDYADMEAELAAERRMGC